MIKRFKQINIKDAISRHLNRLDIDIPKGCRRVMIEQLAAELLILHENTINDLNKSKVKKSS